MIAGRKRDDFQILLTMEGNSMKRTFHLVLTSAALFAGSVSIAIAQQPAPASGSPKASLVDEALAGYNQSKKVIVAAAEAMPDMPGHTGPEVEALYMRGANWLSGSELSE
jgi:hypothetical protein